MVGSDKPKNLLLLHKECHKQVTNSKNENTIAIWRQQGIMQQYCFCCIGRRVVAVCGVVHGEVAGKLAIYLSQPQVSANSQEAAA